MVLPLHQCFHSGDSWLPSHPQPWLGGQVSAGGTQQPATGMLHLPATSGLFAQLHFHLVEHSTLITWFSGITDTLLSCSRMQSQGVLPGR